MKKTNIILMLAAAVALPALVTSCASNKTEEEAKPVDTPKQEAKAAQKNEPAFVETPAPAPAKEEAVVPAPAPAKAETAAAAPAPEKKAEPKTAALPCKHTVKTGDNLWRLSVRYYGKGRHWKKIYDANPKTIKKMDFLEPGTVLTIPAL